jgi:hypothetical protein
LLTPLRRRAAFASALVGIALSALATGCGTKEDNTLGVAFIEDQGASKAVRQVDVSPPATTQDFQNTSQVAGTGSSSVLLVGQLNGYVSRAFARFDTTAIPPAGTVLGSATLEVVFLGGSGDDLPLSVALHRITGDWSETAQDTIPAFATDALDTLVMDPQASLDTLRFDVAELVQFWIDNPGSNRGVMLAGLDGSARMLELSSSETSFLPRIFSTWTAAEGDTTSTSFSVEDVSLITTDSSFQPVAELPGRMTIARGFVARGFVMFDIPDLGARATINRAEIVLHIDAAQSSFDQFQLVYQRVIGPTFEDADTSVDPTFFGNASVSADVDSVVSVVTGLVDGLVSTVNRGLLVRALDERPDVDFVRFHGFDTEVPELAPRLRIWYTPGDQSEDAE